MIAGIFHQGSGLGNQLHRYVAARVLAMKKGVGFGMVAPEFFKGRDFMNLEMGQKVECELEIENSSGKVTPLGVAIWEEGKYEYNPGFEDVLNNTVIDGEFQDERYFKNYLREIREWLKVEPLQIEDYKCVINFRGGEYVGVPDLFLPKEYWQLAINRVRKENMNVVFEVHTDDPETASKFFPSGYPIIHDIGLNWRSIRYTKYLILSNSSFAILPALLNEGVKLIVAPEFWGGRNVGQWRYPMNNYKKFTYI